MSTNRYENTLDNEDKFDILLSQSMPNDILTMENALDSSSYELASVNQYDVNTCRSENRILKSKLKQLQNDLQSEQDNAALIRKKLNTSERERLDSVAKANEEVCHLESEITKLRAQQEKGEAVRQDLELQLTKLKRDVNNEKRNVSERECVINEVNETMKRRIEELNQQIDGLCNDLENTKLNSNEDVRKLKREIEEKEYENGKLRMDVDAAENAKARVENSVIQHKQIVQELETRMHEVDNEKRLNTDELRKAISELDVLKEQHEVLKTEYSACTIRVKSLEDGIEAERAAHLESKFNSEIVQLRFRELEGALNAETSTKLEAINSSEKLNKQLKEMEDIHDEESKLRIEMKGKLEKLQKEYSSLRAQFSHEVEDKKTLIEKLSAQLEEHQANFNELKQELSKAKKKQVNVEETYSGCMKELEMLYENFKLESKGKKPLASKKNPPEKKRLAKSSQPNEIMENLKKTLMAYKHKLDETQSDLAKMKEQKEYFESDCKKYKDLFNSKEKALQHTRKDVDSTSKLLQASEVEKHDLEKLVKQLRDDLEVMHRHVQNVQAELKGLTEQNNVYLKKQRTLEKNTLDFRYSIYHQLCVDLPASEKVDIKRMDFDESSVLLLEYASKLVNNCRWMNEKIRHLEVTLANKEELIEQMQKVHDEQISKLNSMAEGRSQQWVQQKAELEEHYNQLLGEIHSRHKKSQVLADQAWEKVRMTGSVQQGLEKECDELRQEVTRVENESRCLLAACSLLCGAIYPLFQRNQALSVQRGLLLEQLDRFDTFKVEVGKLVDALSMDNMAHQNKVNASFSSAGKPKEKIPLLKFRTGVLAVIAANRLARVNKVPNCQMFVLENTLPGVKSSIVCTGGIDPQSPSKSMYSPDYMSSNAEKSQQTLHWLCSKNLLTAVLASMGDLVSSIQAVNRGDEDSSRIVSHAKRAYQKLMCQIPASFLSVSKDPTAGFQEKNSLIKFLGYGLNKVLAENAENGSNINPGIESSHITLTNLQKHLLEFTQRLHKAEVERRDLRIEVSQLQQKKQDHSDTTVESERVMKELNFLRQQVQSTVDRGRFEEICNELNRALEREQEAQQLLNEQSQQLRELGAKLEQQAGTVSEKDHTLTEAVKGLSETKMEFKRQEQRAKQLMRQVQQLESEKEKFMENVKDAETALRTAAKDKEVLAVYMATIEKILEQVKTDIIYNSHDASSSYDVTNQLSKLLSSDLVPTGSKKVGSELVACQGLVAAFVGSLKQICSRITTLYAEMDQYKQHIERLKLELSAACKREYEHDGIRSLDLPEHQLAIDETPFSPSRTFLGNGNGKSFIVSNTQKNFVPLEEDFNDTYGLPDGVAAQPQQAPYKSRLPVATGSMNARKDRSGGNSNVRRPTEGGDNW